MDICNVIKKTKNMRQQVLILKTIIKLSVLRNFTEFKKVF